jgi:hypothetical protein
MNFLQKRGQEYLLELKDANFLPKYFVTFEVVKVFPPEGKKTVQSK